MILGIYKSPTFTRPVYIYESITTIILNVLDALSLKKFFEKTKSFPRKSRTPFFSWKCCNWKRNNSIQIEWDVKNKLVSKNGVLPLTSTLLKI